VGFLQLPPTAPPHTRVCVFVLKKSPLLGPGGDSRAELAQGGKVILPQTSTPTQKTPVSLQVYHPRRGWKDSLAPLPAAQLWALNTRACPQVLSLLQRHPGFACKAPVTTSRGSKRQQPSEDSSHSCCFLTVVSRGINRLVTSSQRTLAQ